MPGKPKLVRCPLQAWLFGQAERSAYAPANQGWPRLMHLRLLVADIRVGQIGVDARQHLRSGTPTQIEGSQFPAWRY